MKGELLLVSDAVFKVYITNELVSRAAGAIDAARANLAVRDIAFNSTSATGCSSYVDTSIRRKFGGTGLGLAIAIAKQLVEVMRRRQRRGPRLGVFVHP